MINSQAGIQHLSNKLIDIKIDEDREFGVITDENIVAAIMQCQKKLKILYSQVKSDPTYEEAIQKIRGVRKDEEVPTNNTLKNAPPRPGSANRASVMRQTGYGMSFPKAEASMASNIRVKLLQDGEDDDLSDNENDLDTDSYERAKIKKEAARKRELSNSKKK